MYKKQGSGINGAMGVLNNNMQYNKNPANGRVASNIPKADGYEPGANYNQNGKVPSYMQNKAAPKQKRETSNQGRRPNSKVNANRIPTGSNYQIGSKSSQVTSKKAEFLSVNQDEDDQFGGGQDKMELMMEIDRLNQQITQMKKIINEKDHKIETQRAEMTGLRSKNFEFRSKIQEIQDKVKENKKEQKQALKDENKEGIDALRQLQMAMQMQSQEIKNRERDMMMQVMMNSMGGVNSAEAEEERLLQRAIEESKQGIQEDPNNPNTDNMTYEQLLELEEQNGKVSKGLKPFEINRIPEKTWMKNQDCEEESCSICFDNFEKYQKIKKLKNCGHEYHSNCIKKWLTDEKRCPVCNIDVLDKR